MDKWLDAYLARQRIELHSFFKSAHYWCFQRIVNLQDDVAAYQKSKVMPLYIAKYVRFLQQLEAQRK